MILASRGIENQRKTKTIWRHGPRFNVVVRHGDDFSRHRMADRELFSAVIELSCVGSIHHHTGIARREHRRIASQKEKLTWQKLCAIRKTERNSRREEEPAQVESIGPNVLQFQKLKFIATDRIRARRIVHDFGKDEVRPQLTNDIP